MIKNQISKLVKRFITYNNLEFCLEMLTNFRKKNDIVGRQTVARTPNNNCLDERSNKTIIEYLIYMLLSTKVSKVFWIEDNTFIPCLINKCPSTLNT